MHRPSILALDLEGALNSPAYSRIPRPELYEFSMRRGELFTRIVIHTAVEEKQFTAIADLLVKVMRHQGSPQSSLSVIKNPRFIPGAAVGDVLIIDDFEPFIHPDQRSQWLEVDHFDPPAYQSDDLALATILNPLARRVS